MIHKIISYAFFIAAFSLLGVAAAYAFCKAFNLS